MLPRLMGAGTEVQSEGDPPGPTELYADTKKSPVPLAVTHISLSQTAQVSHVTV